MEQEKQGFLVYGLYDPSQPDEVKYVGITRQKLRARLYNHVTESRRKLNVNCMKESWIRGLLSQDKRPLIKCLYEGVGVDDMYEKEAEIIERLRSEGADIFNICAGGARDFGRESPLPPEERNYDRHAVHQYDLEGNYIKSFTSKKEAAEYVQCSPSLITLCTKDENITREGKGFYWRLYKKGAIKPNPPAWGNTGKKRSPETIKKMSEANKGKKWSKEAIEKRSKTNSKPVNQYTADGEFIKKWDSVKSIREELGIKVYSDRFDFVQRGFRWGWAT